MRASWILVLGLVGAVGFATGCKTNSVDKGAFKSAIDDYYKTRQVCLWAAPVKFPAQADTSNDEQTKSYDALTDAGLLTRAATEKKRILIGSKSVNNYDLSDKGRSAWTADQTQPGYGNFCFGHREVSSIDNYNPADPDAAQYSVTFHSTVSGLPDWASTTEMRTAFPTINSVTAAQQVATANLVKSSNGWQVTSIQGAPTGQ
jgi:hypothetical protein